MTVDFKYVLRIFFSPGGINGIYEDGKAEFESEKKKGEDQLADAWDEYNKGKKEAICCSSDCSLSAILYR